MEDPFVELVDLARRALVVPREIRPGAVHRLEAHPRCTATLALLVRAGNFVGTYEWLEDRRPDHVDRDVTARIQRALNEALRGGRPRRPRCPAPDPRPAPAQKPSHPGSPPAEAPNGVGGASSRTPPVLPVRARSLIPPRVAGETVVAVGWPVAALTPFHRVFDEVQRLVVSPEDRDVVHALPNLQPGTPETARWRSDVRAGRWICPWPECPHPELVLRVGEIRVPHVAHVSIRGHGADADWVTHTVAGLRRVTGHAVMVVGQDPLTVTVGGIPAVLTSARWGGAIAATVRTAVGAAGARPVVVLRASRLPASAVPVMVHQEPSPRWGLKASPQLLEGLKDAVRVLAAPDPPRDDVVIPDRTDAPIWGPRWVGLGLEDDRGRLDWRQHPRSPVVAIDLAQERAERALRAIFTST